MTLPDFKQRIRNYIKDYPELKGEILDYYQLAMDEIDEGGSPTNEMSLCISSINDLIEENK